MKLLRTRTGTSCDEVAPGPGVRALRGPPPHMHDGADLRGTRRRAVHFSHACDIKAVRQDDEC